MHMYTYFNQCTLILIAANLKLVHLKHLDRREETKTIQTSKASDYALRSTIFFFKERHIIFYHF